MSHARIAGVVTVACVAVMLAAGGVACYHAVDRDAEPTPTASMGPAPVEPRPTAGYSTTDDETTARSVTVTADELEEDYGLSNVALRSPDGETIRLSEGSVAMGVGVDDDGGTLTLQLTSDDGEGVQVHSVGAETTALEKVD